jgi:putative membrane protein
MGADDRRALALLGVVVAGLAVSGVDPADHRVWVLEVAPWVLVVAALAVIHPRFPLTPVTQLAVFGLCLLFLGGAHHTYSRVPVGLWLRDHLGLVRNPYDRIVHFAGGFVGALVLREVLLRRTRLVRGPRTFAIVSAVALAGAALYEIVEWWIAVAVKRSAEEFLAMQGDEWDTQWDMFLALVASMLAQALLSRLQDRQMAVRGLKREA